ncbi:MAG: insulinase family protein [Acidobacteria bacterium]|nr:insulinase family protein [Acidobacteriota bacterium]
MKSLLWSTPFLASILAAAGPASFQVLPGGLPLVVVENHERPYLELRLEVHWSPEEEPPGKDGLSTVLGRMLESGGAGPFGPRALRRALESRGMELRFEGSPGTFAWILRGPSTAQEMVFEFLAHVALRPRLDGSLLEAHRTGLARELLSMGLEGQAQDRFLGGLLLGYPTAQPTEGGLSRISLEDLEQFRRQVLHPRRARLAVFGDLSPAQARQLGQLHLGVWGPGDAPGASPPAERRPRSRRPVGAFTVVTSAGAPDLTLSLPLPHSLPPDAGEILRPLLERRCRAIPEARLRDLPDGRPCLEFRARVAPGGNAMESARRLAALADGLARELPAPSEASELFRLAGAARAALALHPSAYLARLAREDWEPLRTYSSGELGEALRTWLAPDSRRWLLTGAPLPPAKCGLEELGPIQWVKPGD